MFEQTGRCIRVIAYRTQSLLHRYSRTTLADNGYLEKFFQSAPKPTIHSVDQKRVLIRLPYKVDNNAGDTPRHLSDFATIKLHYKLLKHAEHYTQRP